ncbi:hypothetical protein TNCV_4432231 [Trichonephila clavipes]|nr:hypothetical protein TNCV_4432231 [Trichonephila clavipes]
MQMQRTEPTTYGFVAKKNGIQTAVQQYFRSRFGKEPRAKKNLSNNVMKNLKLWVVCAIFLMKLKQRNTAAIYGLETVAQVCVEMV